MRLGVFADQTYVSVGGRVSTNRAFVRFVTSLPPRVDEVVVFGRLDPVPGTGPYELSGEGVRFVPLPFYRRVSSVPRMLGVMRESARVFGREIERLDAVWIFGPHPVALLFSVVARRRGVPLVLGVRQDYPTYIAGRLPSRWWRWAVGAAWALDRVFRLLARRAPTVALGDELARHYAGGAPVLATGFSLVPEAEVTDLDQALRRAWDGELQLLSVGRLDPEKNPLLLVDVIAELRARDPRWRLVVAGDGPSRPEMERRAAERGIEGAVDFLGEVPNGPALWELYRQSNVFLHVSLTEGLPQVLFEAQAAGLPIVATAVGGVPAALGHGATGLLVPPRDVPAAIAATERLAADVRLRQQLVAAGLENARQETLEAQLDRVAAFLRRSVPARSLVPPPRRAR